MVVSGASCDRAIDTPLATALAEHFTVLNYDRRGRGDSTDTLPFAVEREVEDIDALLAAAGGSAALVGLSSGAALAAEAALAGLPIDALVMWEPPFRVDAEGLQQAKDYTDDLTALLSEGRRGDALARFMRLVGLPEEMIAGMRHSPFWASGEALAPTLAYDNAALGDGSVPTERYRGIATPTLVLAGSASPAWLREAAIRTANAIPGARHDSLDGQDHNVAPDALTEAVVGFVGR